MSRAEIVVPCYNEAERLDTRALEAFLGHTPDIAFLFIDDGSTDGTRDVLERFCSRYSARCRLFALPGNKGKAEAVRHGILAALRSPSKYVGFWDADFATPLDAIPTFCDLLDGRPDLEVVIGSRVQLLGRRIERRAVRHYVGRVFATAVSLVLGVPVYDTQCGAKLFRAHEELHRLFQQPFLSKWVFDVEVLARMIRSRSGSDRPPLEEVVYELPLMEWRDIAGSKLRLRDFLRAATDVAAIYWRILRPGIGRSSPPARLVSAAADAEASTCDGSQVSPSAR